MLAVVRCLLLTVLVLVGFTAKASTGSYQVYTDYAGNIYLEAPKKFVLIHGEVSVPLSLMPANGLLRLMQDASGWRYEVLTQAQWNALELTAGHSGVASAEFADLNGDGKSDIRLNFANLTLGALLISDINGNPSISEISSANNSYDPVEAPPSSSMPANAVGLSAGEFRVDESGGATYQMPLTLPAGIAGVQPQLAFSYNSNAGDGYMGTGWSFSGTSAITRCPKNFIIDGEQGNVSFANTDRLCLGGQRLLATSNTDSGYWSAGTYRPEIDDFSIVRAHGSATQGALGYTVETKSGEIHYYGEVSAVSGSDTMAKTLAATFKTADGAVQTGSDAFFNTKSGENIARVWALKAIRDVKGNYIVFKYAEDLSVGEHYLTEVHYTGRVGGNAPFAKVILEYTNNPKKARGWQAGVPVGMTKLLNKVHVYIDNEYYRHYQLNYQTTNVVEEKNYLQSIQECVTNDGKGCLPLTSFKWSHPALATPTSELVCPGNGEPCVTEQGTSDFKPFETTSTSRSFTNERQYTHFIDINGDGFVDIVYPRDGRWRVRLGNLTSTWSENCSFHEGFRDCYDVAALSAFNSEIDLGTFGVANKAYTQTIDYDGDGKRDLLVAERDTMTWRVIRFEPSSSSRPACARPQEVNCGTITTSYAYTLEDTYKLAYGYNSGATVADVDGDGLEDIVFIKDSKFQVYRNLGTDAAGNHRGMSHISDFGSFNSTNANDGFISDYHTASADMKSASMFDMNGDGKTDIILKVTEGRCSVALVTSRNECVNDVRGTWTVETVYKLFTSNGNRYSEAQNLGEIRNIRAGDFNGDGYTDIIYRNKYSNYLTYRLSNGKTFGAAVQSYSSVDDSKIDLTQFVDLNGDGRTDFLIPDTTSRWQLLISKAATSPSQVAFEQRGTLSFDSGALVRFTDINADGKLDMLTATSNSSWKIFASQRPFIKDHVIKGITNGWGVKTSINYQSMVDTEVYFARDSTNNVNSDYFSPLSGMYVVSDVSTDTSTNKTVRVDYQYGGLLLHKKGRGMLGFELLQTKDIQTGVLTRTVYHQLWPFTGIPKLTTQWFGDEVLSSAENTLAYYDFAANTAKNYSGSGEVSAAGRVFPYIKTSVETSNQLGSDMTTLYNLAKTTSSFAYDSAGNLTASTVVQSNPAETSYKLTTSTSNIYTGSKTYYPRYGRLTKSTVTKTLVDSKGTQSSTRVSSFGYNNDLMLETETLAPDEPKFRVVTTHSYDAAGNSTGKTVTAASKADGTAPQSRSSTTLYDSRFRLVKQTTDALGYTTDFTYNGLSADTVTGRIDYITQRDANNMVSRVYFDITGRQYRSYSKGAASTDPIVNTYSYQDYCASVSCAVAGAYARITTKGDGQGEKQSFIDKYGREFASRVKLFNNSWSVTHSTFDEQGRPLKVYEPYTSAPGAFSQAEYDDLGRISSTLLANGGTTSLQYRGLTTVTTDALNHTSTTLNNYAGQARRVTDHLGNKLEYYYDANGNLKTVVATDTAGTASTRTTNTYDAYGRKTAMSDQDKGNWSYSYNAFGELMSQTNAKGQITAFTYDAVGRQLRRHDASGTTCWDYGDSEISYNRGKLVRVRSFNSTVNCDTTASADYEEIYGYNSRGLVSNKLVRTAGSSFSISTSYDAYNRLYTLTYPSWSLSPSDDIVVRHEYSANNGMLTALKNHKNANEIYQQVMAVNARGQTTEVKYGNGAKETRGFAADTGWVEALNLYNKAGALAHSFGYGYQKNGNLDWRDQRFGVNSNASFNEDFVYDDLDRLKTRTISNIGNSTAYNALPSTLRMSESYTYDNWGNIKSKTGVGHYSYDASKTNRLTGVWSGANGTGTRYYNFAYDSNGNIESDGKRTFTYTAFEKPSRITQDSNYTDFGYGPDRQLYRRTDLRDGKTTDTLYIDGLYERMTKSTGESEHKFYVGNAVITKRSNSAHSDILYLHKDNQGSTISITNAAGNVVQQFIYDPWGKQYSVSTSSVFSTYSNPGDSKGYTGHKMINDFDVIHMGGRTYNPILGRFMQADPFIQFAGNLQSYNRYSYVLNNPMSYTDPSGYFSFNPLKKIGRAIIKGAAKVFGAEVVNIVGTAVATYFGGPWGTAAWTYEFNRAMGVSSSGALRSAAIAGATAFAFQQIGEYFNDASNLNLGDIADSGFSFDGYYNFGGNYLTAGQVAGQITAHAVVGGVSASLQGGKFGHGFFSAGVTKGLGTPILDATNASPVAGTIVSAVIGGTASVVSGGKFANGAATAAFQALLNHYGERFAAELKQLSQDEQNSEIVKLAEQLASEAAQYVDGAGLVPPNLPDWLHKMVRGIYIHREFSNRINRLGIPGFRGEGPSYYFGDEAYWSYSGSSRPDATWGPIGKPYLAFELKTGAYGLSPYQLGKYQMNLPKQTELVILRPMF